MLLANVYKHHYNSLLCFSLSWELQEVLQLKMDINTAIGQGQ